MSQKLADEKSKKLFSTRMAICAMSTLLCTILCDIISFLAGENEFKVFLWYCIVALVLSVLCSFLLSKGGKKIIDKIPNKEMVRNIADIGSFIGVILFILEKISLQAYSIGIEKINKTFIIIMFGAIIILIITIGTTVKKKEWKYNVD